MARNFVLSAAHCVHAGKPKILLGIDNLAVRIGGYKLDSNYTGREKFINIKRIILHPDYNPSHPYKLDIVLLELATDINIDIYTPACLPLFSEGNKFDGKLTTQAGWGKHSDSDDGYPNEPYEVMTTISRPDECPFSSLDPSVLCSGLKETLKGTCSVRLVSCKCISY